jgi:murein DD-endopeptidase MepM/ murein hydrolase activator NlpD
MKIRCFLLIFFLTACQSALPLEVNRIDAEPAQPATSQIETSSPELSLQVVTPNPDQGDQSITDIPTSTGSTPDTVPLRFVFPTPGSPPVSAWRPPLYPTPWAPTPYDHFYFGRPIGADQVNWPLADYRYGGVFFKNEVHTGVDIPAPRGTPVLAAGSGKINWAGFGLYSQTENLDDPYGLAVSIRHNFGYQGNTLFTVYGHMDKIFVVQGQYVNTGDMIGLVGDTGHVTGVHLHFEVRVGKDNFYGSRNPELWTSPPMGWGILAARVMRTDGGLLDRTTVNIHSLDTNQYWDVKTYGIGAVNPDPFYKENMVIGDLPAGRYDVWIKFDDSIYNQEIQIQPGLVSFFTFQGEKGFKVGLPPIPGTRFTPPTSAFVTAP